MGRVVVRDRCSGKQMLEEEMAERSVFVEHEARTGDLAEDRHESGTGGRFEDDVIGHDAGGPGRDIAER